ncbi:MAG: LamG domain-containing protein [Candidatus Omnitrophota bacterium]
MRRKFLYAGMAIALVYWTQILNAGVLDGKDIKAWWKFETKNGGEPIGDSVSPGDVLDDSSPNGIGLEVMSPEPMQVVPRDSKKALHFDGETTYLQEEESAGSTESRIHLTDKFTLAAWFRIEKPPANINLISKNDWAGPSERCFDFGVTQAQNSRLQLFGKTETGEKPKEEIPDKTWISTGGGPIPIGTWQFLAVTFDGKEVRFYNNGQLTNTVQTPFTTMRKEPVPVTVGSNLCNGKGAAIFQGEIGEAFILGEALTHVDIKKLYEETNPSKSGEQQKELDDLIKNLK